MTMRRHGARGFGLLELLVALALVAATVAAGFQILGAAARGTGDADRYTRAVLLAESRMAELGVTEALRPGETMGEAGEGYLWRVTVRPLAGYVPQGASADGGPPLVPLEVHVTVAEVDGRIDQPRLATRVYEPVAAPEVAVHELGPFDVRQRARNHLEHPVEPLEPLTGQRQDLLLVLGIGAGGEVVLPPPGMGVPQLIGHRRLPGRWILS